MGKLLILKTVGAPDTVSAAREQREEIYTVFRKRKKIFRKTKQRENHSRKQTMPKDR
jgi:hypothetical protein